LEIDLWRGKKHMSREGSGKEREKKAWWKD